jgi:hypothetical protein
MLNVVAGLNVDVLLVKEWLEDDDFVARLNKGHEGAEHAYLDISSLPSNRRCQRGSSPSLAPVVMVTSVSGSSVRPQKGE